MLIIMKYLEFFDLFPQVLVSFLSILVTLKSNVPCIVVGKFAGDYFRTVVTLE